MFLIRYIAAFVIGSAAVYFLAPAIWERSRESSEADYDGFPMEVAGPADNTAEKTPGVSVDARGATAGDAPAVAQVHRPAPKPKAQPAAKSAGRVLQAREAPPAPSAKMSLESIPQSSDQIIRWGVTEVDAPVFKKDGKRFPDKVSGGSLVEIEKTTFASNGDEMALCSVWRNGGWHGPYLVPTMSLVMFEGTREGFEDAEVAALMKYHQLNASLENRKKALEEEAVNANPHSERLRQLDKENKAMAAKVKELTKERDESTGAKRSNAADELRRLEAVATKNNRELAKQVALYKEWKAKHPIKQKTPEEDPRCRELSAAMRELAPALAIFGVAQ